MPVNPMVLLAHALSVDGAASRARRCFDLYRLAVCSVPIHRLLAAQPPTELAELIEAGAPAIGAQGAGSG